MKKKDPPDYLGDEAVTKAFGEAVRRIRLEKGLSFEQADALLKEAVKNDRHPLLYRALGIVVPPVPRKAEHVSCGIEQRVRLASAIYQQARAREFRWRNPYTNRPSFYGAQPFGCRPRGRSLEERKGTHVRMTR